MYSKLFSSILSSSIWSEDSDTCKVWITLLAMQDREGYVFGSPAGIARIAALNVGTVETALQKFVGPDDQSADLTREPFREGRRVEVVPGGWRLLNAEHYRALGNEDARREQNREAKRKQREKESDGQQESATVSNSQQASSLVPKCHPSEADASSDSDSDSRVPPPLLSTGETPTGVTRQRKKREPFKPPGLDEVRAYAAEIGAKNANPDEFHGYWTDEDWVNGKGRKLRDWRKAFRNRERSTSFARPRLAREINPDVLVGKGNDGTEQSADPESLAKLRELHATRREHGLTIRQVETKWHEWEQDRKRETVSIIGEK